MDPNEARSQASVAESAQAAAVAQEAAAKAHEQVTKKVVVEAFRELFEDSDTDSRPLLIKRIPFICNDIIWIKKLLWVILGANGAVLLAIVTLAIQRAFS